MADSRRLLRWARNIILGFLSLLGLVVLLVLMFAPRVKDTSGTSEPPSAPAMPSPSESTPSPQARTSRHMNTGGMFARSAGQECESMFEFEGLFSATVTSPAQETARDPGTMTWQVTGTLEEIEGEHQPATGICTFAHDGSGGGDWTEFLAFALEDASGRRSVPLDPPLLPDSALPAYCEFRTGIFESASVLDAKLGSWSLDTAEREVYARQMTTALQRHVARQYGFSWSRLYDTGGKRGWTCNPLDYPVDISAMIKLVSASRPPADQCAEAFSEHPILSATIQNEARETSQSDGRVIYGISGTMEHFEGEHEPTTAQCTFTDGGSGRLAFQSFVIEDSLGTREVSLVPAYVPETERPMFCLWKSELAAMESRIETEAIAAMGRLNRRGLPAADRQIELGRITDAETASFRTEAERLRRHFAISYGARALDLERTASVRGWSCH